MSPQQASRGRNLEIRIMKALLRPRGLWENYVNLGLKLNNFW